MKMDNVITSSECCKTKITSVCWTAILAGSFVGMGLGFLLNMFGVAIGLSAYSATPNGATVIALGGIIGLLIGAIVAMGTAGFVAGYLGRFHHCYCHGGVLYGFITWALSLILSALLVIPMTHYISFYEDNLNPSFAPVEMTNSIAGDHKVIEKQIAHTLPVTIQAKHLAWSSWILFILFFVGAFSSCIGACYGMRCKKEQVNASPQ